jgi:DNA-binding beta-propeller fold protein YncE
MNRTTPFLLPLLLTAPLAAQRMFALDSSRAVYEIDLATAARTLVGTISSNAGTTGGFTYDINTGRLWLTSSGNDSVYLVDMTNWSAKLVGNYGLGTAVVMHGIEWDDSTGTLYAMSQHDNGLYTVDQTTGAATLVGLSGLTAFSNLGYSLLTNTMYVVNSGADSLYTIDRATGVPTLVGAIGAGTTNSNGVAFNIDNQTLYMADNLTDNLYAIDVTTGAGTVVGSTASTNLLGLVYVPGAGRLTRAVHGCGQTTIRVSGHPAPGSTITTELGNVTGIPLVGYGVVNASAPFCGCTIGHEWAVAAVGTTMSFAIPPNPALAGVQLLIQGTDFLGAGGCASPQLTLTDTITVTIG